MADDLHDQILARIRKFSPAAMHGRIPPPIFAELAGRWIELTEGERLAGVFPAAEKFANPMGTVQGGILSAALDAAYGTLAFLTAEKPATSISLDTSFVRPLPTGEDCFRVDVWVTAQTRTLIYLDGKVSNAEGKTVATSKSVMLFLDSARRTPE